jgi:hypothetical protein
MGNEPASLGIMDCEMVVDDERMPIFDLITRIMDTPAKQAFQMHCQSLMRLCTKIFLYWHLEQSRHVEECPYSQVMRQLSRTGPKKSAKLQRQARKLYDRTLLGPITLPLHLHGIHGDITPHWRRGHFRMQPHGPSMALRKLIFIAPTLVRADRLVPS